MNSIDNFNNDQYFQPYMDLINQPSAADAMGDAFSDQSKQPAYGKKQRLSNAVSRGIGAGLKAVSNTSKQKQIEPLLEKLGQINAINSTLQVELAEKKEHQFKANQAFEMASPAYFEWAKSKMAGDEIRSPRLARAVFDNVKNILGMSEFDHEHGGFFYGTDNKTGEIKGVNLVHYASQNGIDLDKLFGPDSGIIKAASSDGAAAEYQNTQELQRQQLAMGQANINDKRSHTNLQDMQAEEIGHKIENPQLSPSQIKTKDLNEVKFAKLHEKAEEKRILSIAYGEYIDNILEAKKKGLTGKSKAAEWNRYWAGITGQSENMDVEEMLRITHANRVKELGGSNANIRQFDVAMASAPSITKDPDATIKFLDKIIDENTEFEKEVNHIGSIWENNNYQGQERSILNEYRKENPANKNRKDRVRDEDKNPEQPSDAFVVMTNQETGEEWDVPKGQVELFSNNGYK